jgi:protein-tyrosine-phosphatase
MNQPEANKLRVLFLCTRNSARSQIAEAVMMSRLARQNNPRFEVGSAGSAPGDAVHPLAIEALTSFGIDWRGRSPKGYEAVQGQRWDLIITVCDRAREACPSFPGQPAFAHWGMDDPASVFGDTTARERAFRDTVTYLSRRIDLLMSLRFESLERSALELRVEQIATEVPVPRSPIAELH